MEGFTMKFKALLLLLTLPVISRSMDRIPLMGAGTEFGFKTAAGAIANWALTVLGHELGHAIAGKLLFNAPIDIHIGTEMNPTGKPLFSIGGLHVHGLPLCGLAEIKHNKKPATLDQVIDHKSKDIAVLGAGPLGGLVTGIAVQAILNKFGFGSFFSLLPQFVNLANLIPMKEGNCLSDGKKIWENIKHIKSLLQEKKFVQEAIKSRS